MAKDSQPPSKPSPSKGRSKSERHSDATRRNKARQVSTRRSRRLAAAARRDSLDYTYPDGRKQGTQARRGTPLHRAVLNRRMEQAQKINRKAEQRRNFSALEPGLRMDHRIAGKQHHKPRDL